MGIIYASYGNSKKFYETKKSSLDAPEYLKNLGFNGYEYMCNEGVHISDDACEILGKNAKENDIALSVRAYDFLSLSDEDDNLRQKSIDILCETVRIAKIMGAKRVSFPLDNCAIRKRSEVFSKTVDSLEKTALYMKENNISDIFLCPETMGLIHDLGTVDEVISLCMRNKILLPAINVGNIYARSLGEDKSEEYFLKLFDKIKKKLGKERGNSFHLYFSKVDYTHHGLKETLDFSECQDENQNFSGVVSAIKKAKVSPFIVVKSPDNKEKDLKTVFDMMES